jgi:signal transduction histidine kinase
MAYRKEPPSAFFCRKLHRQSLISNLQDLSKVEAGKTELDLGEVRIRELLENSLVMVKEKALKHQLRLTVDLNRGAGVDHGR